MHLRRQPAVVRVLYDSSCLVMGHPCYHPVQPSPGKNGKGVKRVPANHTARQRRDPGRPEQGRHSLGAVASVRKPVAAVAVVAGLALSHAAAVAYPTVSSVSRTKHRSACAESAVWPRLASAGLKLTASVVGRARSGFPARPRLTEAFDCYWGRGANQLTDLWANLRYASLIRV